ncbi:MAG: DNA repair protein RecN, partial [Myxococcota bacterium]
SGDDAVAALLARTLRRLEEGAGLDPKPSPMLEPIASALAVISETGRDLGDYSRSIDSSPEGVAKVEGRLTSLKRLARRHGGDLSLACRALDSLREELCRLEDHDLRFEEARRRVEAAELEACRAAERVRAARSAAARSLDSEVARGLEQLRMAGGRVALSVQRSEIGPSGADRVEIGLSSGPGLPLRPISKVASGGELSRLLLAFRRAIAEVDGVGTLVFDEADAGVGGAVAEAVGRLMAEVAKSRQVLCVTHLPQLAVHASHHIVVTKSVGGGGSGISATVVENESRVEELGRMLGGREITAATRANARDLLENATSSPTRKRPARRRPKPRASPLPLSAE